MDMRLDFDVSEDQQQLRLVGLTLPGFGWIVGGARNGDVTFTVDLKLDIPLEADQSVIQKATVIKASMETASKAYAGRRFYVGEDDR